MARLELDRISKSFGAARVVDEVSLAVESGEFLVLVGPSGCGKSTLLRIVAGLLPASAGEIRLDGARVDQLSPRERDVAMVFQNYALYPHLSVRGNLAFPLRVARVPAAEIERRVRETAATLGLGDLLERKPGALSGGQMQRVALGRAIIRRPKLFLFDEPLSNLDAKLRGEMRVEIVELHRRLGATTLYVTHDQAEAMTMGSRIAVLCAGKLVQVGAPLEVFERPASEFVAAFIGGPPMNLVRAMAEQGELAFGGLRLRAPGGLRGAVTFGVRPHQLALVPGDAATVVAVERLGTQTLVTCEIGAERVLSSSEGTLAIAPGARVDLRCEPETVHWFDARTGQRL